MKDLRTRMECAADAAWRAGRITLRYFQGDVGIESKSDATPVTQADRETEQFLVEFLGRAFPDDGILGEEFGEKPGTSGLRWVVDPIDGTKSFIHGVPLYGVLIAAEDASGESVVGAVCLPALGDLVVAARGEGCYWNGRRARVSDVAKVEEACVCATGGECFEMTSTQEAYRDICGRARLVRGWGDCYGHVLVATGRAEVMLDPILADWDAAALLPIVEEAGGVFTDWVGRRTTRGKSAVSTNAGVADEVRRVISGSATRSTT